jgi:hypothetical protein
MARNGITGLSTEKIRDLARAGAEVALTALRAEIAAIERAFPELAQSRGRRVRTVPASLGAVKGSRRRTRMSAAARKAVSERMKRYWANRRKRQ